jgi:microsomal dipeptidase-like Zn-dependent dipeptidase
MSPKLITPLCFLVIGLSALTQTPVIKQPIIKQPIQTVTNVPIQNVQLNIVANTPFFIKEERFWANDTHTGQLATEECVANDNRWKWVQTSNGDGTVTISTVVDNNKKLLYRDNTIIFQGERRGQKGFFIETPLPPGSLGTGNRYVTKFYLRPVSGDEYWLTASDRRDSVRIHVIPIDKIPFNTIAFDFSTMTGWNLAEGPAGTHAFAGQPSAVNYIPYYDSPVIPPMPLGGDYWKELETSYFSTNTKTAGKYINTARPGDNRFIRPDETKTGILISQPFYLCQEKMGFRIGGTQDDNNIKIELLQKADAAGAGTIAMADGPYRTIPATKATGHNNDITRIVYVDTRAQKYTICRVRITDNSTTGHIEIDGISFGGPANIGSEPRPNDPALPAPNKPIWGAVDMHTHPMSYLGMGGKLMHGQPDGDPSIALGNCNCDHGGWGTDNMCGNYIRAAVVNIVDHIYDKRFDRSFPVPHPDHPHDGYPGLANWPSQTSMTHQQMWWEWIKRAKEGGMKVIIALTVNSELLGRVLDGASPYDDMATADRQIDALTAFVYNHRDFMDTVTTSARMREVVNSGRMAVIIGMEVDNIGNFYRNVSVTKDQIRAEIARLKTRGVRYIFPIHVVDNKFGGSAVYEEMFNYSTKYSTSQPITGTVPPLAYPPVLPGKLFQVESAPDRRVTYRLESGSMIVRTEMRALIEIIEAGGLPPVSPEILAIKPFVDPAIIALSKSSQFQILKRIYLDPHPEAAQYDRIRVSPSVAGGHRNIYGLSDEGKFAIREMMRQGIMIDVDHASEKSVSDMLLIAKQNDYPVNSGHNGLRAESSHEKTRTLGQLDTIRSVGGMMGVGWEGSTPGSFYQTYRQLNGIMGGRSTAIGSDIDGYASTPGKPTSSSQFLNYTNPAGYDYIQKYTMPGSRSWDYNTDGMAHYGLVPDFFEAMKKAGADPAVLNSFFLAAEYFAQMWEKCERRAPAIPRE